MNINDILLVSRVEQAKRRFFVQVAKGQPDECWKWQGTLTRELYGLSYGRFNFGAYRHLAHRVAWVFANGAIPKGLHVLHRCDTPPCCNPEHLFLGTHADNMADMTAKKRVGRGVAVNTAVFTEERVRAIRNDPRAQRIIADSYGVNQSTISLIKRCRSWQHVV